MIPVENTKYYQNPCGVEILQTKGGIYRWCRGIHLACVSHLEDGCVTSELTYSLNIPAGAYAELFFHRHRPIFN